LEEIIAQPEIIECIEQEALQTAKNRTWSKYGQEIAESIMELHC